MKEVAVVLVGLADKADWPRRGKLSAMIVQSVKQNA